MTELIVDLSVSLDGFASGADGTQRWGGDYFGPDLRAHVATFLGEPQVKIMGRATYELLSRYWPSARNDPNAAAMNAHPKVVFSRSLQGPLAWSHARVASGDLAQEIAALKRTSSVPIRCLGSLSLVRSMMRLGLVDRLRLLVFPLVLGAEGQRPIFEGYARTGLALMGMDRLDSGIAVLDYRRA